VALKALGFALEKPDLFGYMTTHGVPPLSWQPPAAAGPSSKAAGKSTAQDASGAVCPPPTLQLTQTAFQAIAGGLVFARDPREEILRAFRLFDAEDKGVITVEDLRRVAREIGEDISEEELASRIEEFDMNGKGGVGQDEFLAIVSDD
jgi:centrin-3